MTSHERMRAQLQRQIGYLQRSSRLFDLGYLDEAIRIATCLRVLFHDRPRDPSKQGSVYKLLGRPPLSLRTTVKPRTLGPGVFAYDGYLHLPGNLRPWEDYLKGDAHLLHVDAWWSQVIFVVDRNHVTRRQLVLWAAEKDGGAHSDVQLNAVYEAIFRMWTPVPTDAEIDSATPVPHQHLFALRRFALEILASDDLMNFAWPDGRRPELRIIADWPTSWSPIMDRVHDVASVYVENQGRPAEQRDTEAIGKALQLVDEIRLRLSEWRADSLTRNAQYAAALSGYAAIQAVWPGHQHSLYALGYVSHRLGFHAEAETHLSAAIASDPDHIPSLLALANLYFEQDKFEAARPLLQRILQLDTTHQHAKTNLQILQLSERALQPESALSSLTELGSLYLSLNLTSGAKDTFERVLKIDPENQVAKLQLQRLEDASRKAGDSAA